MSAGREPLRTTSLAALAIVLAACGPQATSDANDNAADIIVAPSAGGLAAFLDCVDDTGQTLVAAHRGGPSAGFPENALETFAHTLADAPGLIETDVRVTADGVLILMHDEDLDRTSTCAGQIAEKTYADLATCRLQDPSGAGTPFSIPSLEAALQWANGRAVLQLDIKPDVAFEDVLDAVRAADAYDRVVLITYSTGAAARLARLDDRAVLSVTVERVSDLDDLDDAGVDLDNVIAWTGADAPRPSLLSALEEEGIPAAFGTLGHPSRSIDGDIERSGDEGRYVDIAADGVDIISTDRPVAAYAALAARDDPADEIAACRADAR